MPGLSVLANRRGGRLHTSTSCCCNGRTASQEDTLASFDVRSHGVPFCALHDKSMTVVGSSSVPLESSDSKMHVAARR
jgi:hypothetical protein